MRARCQKPRGRSWQRHSLGRNDPFDAFRDAWFRIFNSLVQVYDSHQNNVTARSVLESLLLYSDLTWRGVELATTATEDANQSAYLCARSRGALDWLGSDRRRRTSGQRAYSYCGRSSRLDDTDPLCSADEWGDVVGGVL